MKLLDLLVKELPKLGGWPEGVTHVGQDYDRELRFYGRGEPRTGIILDELAVDHRKIGASDKGVTKSQYDSALAASDGWIEWHGGKCQVDSDAIVEVRYRNPIWNKFNNDRAGDFTWSHDGFGGDIIAYRLQHPGFNSRANNDRLENDLNECIGQDIDVPEWKGDGIPPVGTVCMANLANGWTDVKVAYIGDEGGCREALVFEIKSTKPAWADEFRPLRTEVDKARDEAIQSMASVIDYRNGCSSKPMAGWLYDAIAAGKIPGVRLEGK